MKIDELKNKTIDQLKSILIDLKKESFNLRFQKPMVSWKILLE